MVLSALTFRLTCIQLAAFVPDRKIDPTVIVNAL